MVVSIVERVKDYHQYVGKYVGVSGETHKGGEWKPYGFVGWVAGVSVGADIIYIDVDYGYQFPVFGADWLRGVSIEEVQPESAANRPAWEVEPHLWKFTNGAWQRKEIPAGKTDGCRACELFDCSGPAFGEFTQEFDSNTVKRKPPELPPNGAVDVIFVGEALGAVEAQRRRPFVGPAGQILRPSIEQVGITSCGITNIWKCKPPGNVVPGDVPGQFCQRVLLEELTTHGQKVVVPLGGTALNALTSGGMNITQVQGRMFSTKWQGHELVLLPMLHPAFLLRKRAWWRDWELSLEKLARFLKTGSVNYIPLSKRKVHTASSAGHAIKLLQRLRSSDFPRLDIDIETNSYFMPWEDGYILSIAFGWTPTESVAIPWRYVTNFPEVRSEVKALLEDRTKKFVGYNLSFDVQFLWNENMQTRIGGDSMLLAHLNDERGEETHSLKKDSGVFLNASDWEEGIKQWTPKKDDPYTNIPEANLLVYNGMDTMHNIHLEDVLTDALREEWGEPREDGWGTPLAVYERISIPGANMLARARHDGMRIDMYRLKELHDRFVPVIDELTQECIRITGDAYFNPNSPPQKLSALHKRGIRAVNTRAETLLQYEGDELVDAFLAYSQAHKIFSTYIKGIADDISDDLRVHPDFRLPTETGRNRCSDPNMLGMPRKAEEKEHKWKRFVKEIFIADSDRVLIHVDQKQSEVRCACFLSADEALERVIRSGHDMHGAMASLMYGEGWTHEQRVWAKMVTFGLIYNREAPSLARQLTVIARADARAAGLATYHKWSVREAQAIIDKFWLQMPRLLQWKKEIMKEAVANCQLVSWFGRVRRFGLITWQNKKHVENEAVNFPPSSLSTDINMLNCIEAFETLGKYGLQVHVPIHDALLGSVPKDSMSLVDEVKAIFETGPGKILHTNLPFEAEVTVGERWSDL